MNIPPTVVLAVDAARVRVFRVEGVSPLSLSGLVEVVSLARPETPIYKGQRYTDSDPRRTIGGRGSPTFDDQRREHEDEDQRRYAKLIATSLVDAVPPRCQALICVTHAMHAPLREALASYCPRVTVEWYPHECTKLTPNELSSLLAENGLLPLHRGDDRMADVRWR